MINKKDGKSETFNKRKHINFAKSLLCLESAYDVMWQYDNNNESVICHHLLISNSLNYSYCSVNLPTIQFQPNHMEVMPVTKKVNIMNSELSLPKDEHSYDAKDHAAVNMLACLENIFVSDRLR